MKKSYRWVLGALFLIAVPGLHADRDVEAELQALEPQSIPSLVPEIAPGATFVITAEQIESSGAANIYEVLRYVPGMDVRYTPMGGFVSIRGSGDTPFSSRVLLLIDGTPFNSPDKGGFPGHPNYDGFFPLNRIDRIEIVKGALSIRYGGNAFDGVINIISKKPAETVTEVSGQAFSVKLAAGERELRQGRAAIQLVRGGWEATLGVGKSSGETPIMMNGDAEHERSDLYAAVRRGNLRVSLLTSMSKNASFDNDGSPTFPAEHRVTILDSHYTRRVGEFVLRGSASLNQYRGTTCGVCHNPNQLPPDDLLTTDIGAEREQDRRLRVSFDAERSLGKHHDIRFGIESTWDRIERDVVKLPGSPDNLQSGGAFVKYDYFFRDRGLRLTSGVRTDWLEGLSSKFSPRVGLVWESPVHPLMVHGSWSRAYRAPTWNDRFINQNFLPNGINPSLILTFQGNPDVEREKIQSYQAGVAARLHASTILRADLFYNRIYDRIERVGSAFIPGMPSQTIRITGNRPDSYVVQGGELTVTCEPNSKFDLLAAWAYRDAELAETEAAAAYAPHNRLIFTARYKPNSRWSADLHAIHSSSYLASAPDVFGVREQPSYELVDLAVRHHVPAGESSLTFSLIGRNVTDSMVFETLIDPLIDTRLRGRTIVFELGATF